MGKVIGYCRVSCRGKQDLANQRLAILEFARTRDLKIDGFVEIEISSRKSPKQRRIDDLLSMLEQGDSLVVAELSRLGRSVGQVITLVDKLVKMGVRVLCIKEGIDVEGKGDLQTKVMITLFSLFAEIERDLISQRTREGLEAARMKGKLLGRPKGSLGTSRIEGKEALIREELKYRVPKSAIARKLGVSRTTSPS